MRYAAYIHAIREQIAIHDRQLTELSRRQPPLTQLEQSAAERSIQIVVEALIGSAKHLNKKLGLPPRSDAYQAVAQLAQPCALDQATLEALKGAVGMRNAIVHDYLNLNWELIHQVIREHRYRRVIETVERFAVELARESSE